MIRVSIAGFLNLLSSKVVQLSCMKTETPEARLSGISTLWSVVCRANCGPAPEARAAWQQLVDRYGGAIVRYLRKLLRDEDAADEVFQEFALRLVEGRLRGADPQRGRFRNFVKGALFHLVADYRAERREWPGPLPAADAVPAAASDEMELDREFTESWCDELLARSWAALASAQSISGQPLYDVLRYRADHPEVRSPQLAEHLTAERGRAFTPAGVRQILHRARERFAVLLLDEVRQSLDCPDPQQLEQELLELGLFEYCRPALAKHADGPIE
jgi:DNA-directed RNA polymerase specialized sigma24 family protein